MSVLQSHDWLEQTWGKLKRWGPVLRKVPVGFSARAIKSVLAGVVRSSRFRLDGVSTLQGNMALVHGCESL